DIDASRTARVIMLLYGNEPRPIILPSKAAYEYEEIIFAIWSQQWPALRASLTFSTGSLCARSFGNRPFDIQCVPTGSVRDVELDVVAMQAGKPLIPDTADDIPDWAWAVA